MRRTLAIQPSSFQPRGTSRNFCGHREHATRGGRRRLQSPSEGGGGGPVEEPLCPGTLTCRLGSCPRGSLPRPAHPGPEAGLGQGTALPALPALREMLCSLRHRPGHFLGFSYTRTSVSPPRPEALGETQFLCGGWDSCWGPTEGQRVAVWTGVVQTQQSPGLQQDIGVLWAHAPIFAVGTKFKDFMFKILS